VDLTELLQAHRSGQPDAFNRLVPLVYDDLRRVARSQLRRLRVGETLDTTGLVHEAYLRLVDQTRAAWQDRGHFFAVSRWKNSKRSIAGSSTSSNAATLRDCRSRRRPRRSAFLSGRRNATG
jgi:hypothetical protein